MSTGIGIANFRTMTTNCQLASIKPSLRIQYLVTFAILSLSAIYPSFSHAQSVSRSSPPLSNGKSLKPTSSDRQQPTLRNEDISLDQKVEQQIKFDLKQNEPIGTNGLRALGGDSSGGGNPEEVRFIAEAVRIRNWLNLAPQFLQKQFGFGIEVVDGAISKTQIACAAEPYLSFIRAKSKKVYFIEPLKTVFLDCELFNTVTSDIEAFRGVIFHEYLRSAGIEGENFYKYSSRIQWMIVNAYEIAHSPVYGNYDQDQGTEIMGIYYRGQSPIYVAQSYYGSSLYRYEVELKKSSDGKWIGEGYIEEKFRMMPCYFPVRVEYQVDRGYTKPVAHVTVTLPASMPDSLELDRTTSKISCPIPPMKIKRLTMVNRN